MIKNNLYNFFFIFLIFLFDRISKILVINLEKNKGFSNYNLNSFLNIELIWNEGIAFGLLSFNEKYYYNILTAIIVVITLIVFFLMLKSSSYQKYGFLMVFGGASGNIFDRLYYASVPDFIDIHVNNFHWFIFNVADIFITLGVFLLIYSEFLKKDHD
jgi:signal peptidase II